MVVECDTPDPPGPALAMVSPVRLAPVAVVVVCSASPDCCPYTFAEREAPAVVVVPPGPVTVPEASRTAVPVWAL
jgi:hypothetical protein